MTVAPAQFIFRFKLHVLPKGFHRIRHYGLLASNRATADTLTRAGELIAAAMPAPRLEVSLGSRARLDDFMLP